jgi:glycosyltransferase involved in cell wall biosynthesis
VRICLLYDCLFPHTVGGAERWYRDIARRLAAEGHEVTYVTLRQWDRGARPDFDGVSVRAVGPRMALYAPGGQRRFLPPIVFGAGVLWHLLRHGRSYDVVHTASFPYFSLLAIALARPLHRFRLLVDWHEVWTLDYWRAYVGGVAGRIGWLVQKLCTRVPQQAFTPSRLQAGRLREEGFRGPVEILDGQYDGELTPATAGPAEPLVMFAGRQIAEKQAAAIVPAIAAARERLPQLRGAIFGDGPEHDAIVAAIAEHGLDGVVEAPGFVDHERVMDAMGRALCFVFPSRREGYGGVIVEAAHRGLPSIVVRYPDNAATELIEDGRNGFVAASASPADLADAIVRVHEAGTALRESTAAWFDANAERVALKTSLDRLASFYSDSARS